MLYKCFACGTVSLNPHCGVCNPEDPDVNIPLAPEFYSEFQYRSKGLVGDLFMKKKTERALQEKLDAVLEKYKRFEHPYFVNYVHLAGRSGGEISVGGGYTSLRLFHSVLVQLGFGELVELPKLTAKLVHSTAFRFEYADFVRRLSPHVGADLDATLSSWIAEQGGGFRRDLPMFIHYLWSNDVHKGRIVYTEQPPPLVTREQWDRLLSDCERTYFRILRDRFRLTLEEFDPSRFVTMYAVDAMSGYEFEDFLGELLTAVGYDVEVTKRSGDQGADLFAERFGKKIVIQAKNYLDNVGNSAVQQALAAKAFYSCDEAIVVTNSHFTPSAKQLAESAGVRLIDREELQGYLDEYNRAMVEAAAETRDGAEGPAVPSPN